MQVVYFIFVSFERVLRYIQIIHQLFDFRRMLQEECIHFDCTASQCFPEKEMPLYWTSVGETKIRLSSTNVIPYYGRKPEYLGNLAVLVMNNVNGAIFLKIVNPYNGFWRNHQAPFTSEIILAMDIW